MVIASSFMSGHWAICTGNLLSATSYSILRHSQTHLKTSEDFPNKSFEPPCEIDTRVPEWIPAGHDCTHTAPPGDVPRTYLVTKVRSQAIDMPFQHDFYFHLLIPPSLSVTHNLSVRFLIVTPESRQSDLWATL